MLFFVKHCTRRVHLAGSTPNPSGAWVTQQARNVLLDLEGSVGSLKLRGQYVDALFRPDS
jgi:putative transposase